MSKAVKILAYHGTIHEFDTFRAHPREFSGYCGIGETILGASFSESKQIASTYPYTMPMNAKKRVVTAYLTINKPARFRSLTGLRNAMSEFLGGDAAAHTWGKGKENATKYREHLESQGYDGITFMEGYSYANTKSKARVWIAFHNNQIEIISNEAVE